MDTTTNTLTPAPKPTGAGFAIAALILGILALVTSLVVVGVLLGLVGLVLGFAHLARRSGHKPLAWVGIVLSALSIPAGIGMGFVWFNAVKMVKEAMVSAGQNSSSPVAQWEGVVAPDITVTNLDGQAIRLSDLKGKRVILDFWATWCGPCVAEIPHFVRLQKEIARDQLVIVGISSESALVLKPFVKRHNVNYPIASANPVDLPEPFGKIQAFPTTFFIDRNGVIQSVEVGSRGFAELNKLALAKDFEGTPAGAPPERGASALKDAANPRTASLAWSANVAGAGAMCVGDWEGDGTARLLVLADRKLHVLTMAGTNQQVVTLPDTYGAIETGRHKQHGARLLAYSSWGQKVVVLDKTGKPLWTYSALMGINGAHWGDLDGDGTDEMVVGMNGFGGLVALDADGKNLWHVPLGNVWGQAVVPAAPEGRAYVLATEAGGSVRLFDGRGTSQGTLKPDNAYYTTVAAASKDRSGELQVLASGQAGGPGAGQTLVAFDAKGRVAWSAPAQAAAAGLHVPLASGDLDGDGSVKWAFIEASGDIVVATAAGEKLAAITPASTPAGLAIVPGKDGHGLLIVRRGSTIEAFSFK
jgi:peroxiredoxin